MKYVFAGLTLIQLIITAMAMYLPEFSREATVGLWILSAGLMFLTGVACGEEW